ncbi:DUF6233 domain-containing protein [Streptomyces sp. ActVer]|uniref:DUF6233 domain-containing protein n=1 Tax=Streptomyces sp. ActVer TaxID=3014558 RepID=UPI0022B437BE|nr:DUF6233 domain-containing protein [Streptomyces sp. ActVer]MCZ4506960.1 DUF6233 domain-containing protein [Streptomyces sp. ActVer]
MNDQPATRLDMLRFLERVQERDLRRTRQWIAVEEQRQVEVERGQQRKPPPPDWLIEQGLNGGVPVYVHVGGCHMAGKRSRGVTREQARYALAQGVDACTHCRADTALGVLDG